MSASEKNTHTGLYQGFEDVVSFFTYMSKQCPDTVRLKRNRGTVLLQLSQDPESGGRKQRGCNCKFTHDGIREAVNKAHMVAESLKGRFSTVSEWLEWYKVEIEEKTTTRPENDLTTYRQIFEQMEDEYFKGRHRNTKRPRSRDIPSDVKSYRDTHLLHFKKVSNWDSYVSWDGIKEALYSPLPDGSSPVGHKIFKDRYYKLKAVAEKANCKKALEKMQKIDPRQTIYKEAKSIDLDTLLELLEKERNTDYRSTVNNSTRDEWCWVSAMCTLYGLRPSEIAAGQNLTQPIKMDGITFPAISDPDNVEMILVIGEWTYFGASTKTGWRLAIPMSKDKALHEKLGVHNVYLPFTKSNDPESFNDNHRKWLDRHNWGITETYAFRHLGNQIGEMNGIPQEIRARSFGHSVTVNEGKYKKRRNLATELGILTRHQRHPLPLDMGKQSLSKAGIDPELPEVKAILRIIYQLDD